MAGRRHEVVEVFEVTLTVEGPRRVMEVRFNSRSSAPVLPVVTDRAADPGQYPALLDKYDLARLAEPLPGLLAELATTPHRVRYRADLRTFQWLPDIRRVMDGPVIKGGAGPAEPQPVTRPSPTPQPEPTSQPEPTLQPEPTPQPHHEPTPPGPEPEPGPVPLGASDAGVLERVDQLHSRLEPLERLAETVADHQRALTDLISSGAGGEVSDEQLAALKEQLKDELSGSLPADPDTGPGPEPVEPGLSRDEVLILVDQKVEGLQADLDTVREQLADLEQRLAAGEPGQGETSDDTSGGDGGLDLSSLQAEAEALLADHEQQLQRSLEPLRDAITTLVSPLTADEAEELVEQLERWIQNSASPGRGLRARHSSSLQEIDRLLQIGALLRTGAKPGSASRPTALALKICKAIFRELGALPQDLAPALATLGDAAHLDWILPAPGDDFNARLHDVKGQEAADVPKNAVARLLSPGALDRDGGSVLEKAQVLVAS